MKKTHSFLLAAGIVLALAFTLSCSDNKGDDPVLPVGGDGSLDGTWQKSSGIPELTINEGEFTAYYTDQSVVIGVKGTITYDASNGSGSLTRTQRKQGSSDWEPDPRPAVTFTYTLSNNILTISDSGGSLFDAISGGLTKQE